jgi:PAS domain S-box-containing protein
MGGGRMDEKSLTESIAQTMEANRTGSEMPIEIWRSVVMDAPYGIVLLNVEGKIIFLNQVSYRTFISKYPYSENILEADFLKMVNPDDQEKVRQGIKNAFQKGAFSSYVSRGLDTQNPIFYQGRIGPVKWEGKIVAVSVIVKDITNQKNAEQELQRAHLELERRVRERTEELSKTNERLLQEIEERKKVEDQLQLKSDNLEEVNTALKVLLKKREEDQKELEEKVLTNMRGLAMPYLEKLKGMGLNDRQAAYVNILETTLTDIVSPFSRNLASSFSSLSPTEIQVANLVGEGKTSKDMAEMMGLSVRTIEGYRDKIRKKLRIKNKKVNLRTHLKSFEGRKQ